MALYWSSGISARIWLADSKSRRTTAVWYCRMDSCSSYAQMFWNLSTRYSRFSLARYPSTCMGWSRWATVTVLPPTM